jgi:hypothetical protein
MVGGDPAAPFPRHADGLERLGRPAGARALPPQRPARSAVCPSGAVPGARRAPARAATALPAVPK